MRSQDVYTEVRNASRQIIESLNALAAIRTEWTALDYGSTLPVGEGENAGLTSTEIGACAFSTAQAFENLLSSGHATNLYRVI
jgi:hypothetical protein